MKSIVSAVLGIGLLLFALPAAAVTYSGTVSGTFKFMGIQAHYCDTTQGMDCTAARFPVSMATGLQPMKDITLTILDHTGGTIGNGSTNRSGVFSVTWNRAGSPPTQITVRVFYQHKDGRFRVVTDTDNVYIQDMVTTTPVIGGNKAVGTWWSGSDDITNIYDGAERMWFEVT